jgi:hypothetical protein
VTEPARTLKDVGHILGAEIDTMTQVFTDICWEVETDSMRATFDCDGELYLLKVTKCPDDVKRELGYPVPERVFCWHCEERIIGSLDDIDPKHPNCTHCPTWEAGCLDEECGACE